MLPSLSTSMFSAAGTLGRPGMVKTLPVSATTKWAPAETLSSRTAMRKFSGAPRALALSLKLYCVLATHTGRLPKAVLAQLGELALGGRRKVNTVGAVDLGGNGLESVGHIGAVLIGKLKLTRLLNQTHDLIGKLERALAALGPDLGKFNVDAELLTLGLDERKLGLGVRRESIDGDHAGQTINVLDVVDVTQQVGYASLECLEVLPR